MIIVNCEQGSPEWHQARCGVNTASLFWVAVSVIPKETRIKNDGSPYKERERSDGKVPGDPSPASDALADETAVERISQEPYGDTYETYAMKRGKEQELWARARYEELYGVEVDESGIALTDDRLFGYSTDGFVGTKGMVEIKTPLSIGKIRHVLETDDHSEYEHQIQGGLWITGREWCDFIMYVPSLEKIGNDIYVKRIFRDEAFIEKLEMDLWKFEQRVRNAESFWRKPMRRDGLSVNVTRLVDSQTPAAADPPWDVDPKPTPQPPAPLAIKQPMKSSLASLLQA